MKKGWKVRNSLSATRPVPASVEATTDMDHAGDVVRHRKVEVRPSVVVCDNLWFPD